MAWQAAEMQMYFSPLAHETETVKELWDTAAGFFVQRVQGFLGGRRCKQPHPLRINRGRNKKEA